MIADKAVDEAAKTRVELSSHIELQELTEILGFLGNCLFEDPP